MTLPAGTQQQPGAELIAGGKALMVIGMIVSFGGMLLQGGIASFVIGFIISVIGGLMYNAGNKQRGQSSSFFVAGGAVDV